MLETSEKSKFNHLVKRSNENNTKFQLGMRLTKGTLQCLLLSYYSFQTSKQRVVVADHYSASLHTVGTIRTIGSYPAGSFSNISVTDTSTSSREIK
jgi:hypothetical protein